MASNPPKNSFRAPLDKILICSAWWLLLMAIILFFPFLRPWWWVFLPFFLSLELRKLYLWWIHWDFNYANIKWAMLEIVPPKEILTPIKAMEDVFTIMWPSLYDSPSWREEWCEGTLTDAPGWMSWEVVSIEGNLHFYIRVNSDYRTALETALYSHYPELEIKEVADYAKNVSQNIPNADWNMYGEDYILGKPAAYPIKTYEKFFEPQGEKISAEEKRIDPMASLLELMSRMGPGEQFWLQFITASVTDSDNPEWRKEGQKIIGKIAKRPEKKEESSSDAIIATLRNLVLGPVKEGSGEKATYKWAESAAKTESGEKELLLTPGEREMVTEIENKLRKPVFRTNIRAVYIAKRENWNPAHRLIARSYFAHFTSPHMNGIKTSGVTRPKVQYFFRKTIATARARKVLRNAIERLTPLFPERKREQAILNTEEMATLFHFPIKISGVVSPGMERINSKKSGPPPNLPTT